MTARLLRLAVGGWRGRAATNLLAFVLVAVAGGGLLLSLQLRDVADDPWEQTFEATNGAHLLGFGRTSEIGRMADVAGVVEAANPIPHIVTTMATGGETYGLRVYGADDPPAVEHPVVTSGRWPGASGEAVLERSLADELGLGVGDAVELLSVDGMKPFTVVGVAVVARESPYPDSQPGEAYLQAGDIRRLEPDASAWSWVQAVRIAEPSRVESIARSALDTVPDLVFVVTSAGRAEDAAEVHRTTSIVLRTFAITLLVALALVLSTLASARVADRAEELGLLKAVGLTPFQIVLVVVLEQLFVALVAATLGAVVGSAVTPWLVRDAGNLLGTVPVEVSPMRIALVVVLVVAVVAVAAAVPAWRLARVGVMRSLDSLRSGGGINRLARRAPLRPPLTLTVAVRRVLARPARSTATSMALALTVASLVAGLAFEATVAHEDAIELEQLSDRRPVPLGGELAPTRPDPVPVEDSTREQLRPIVHGFNTVLVGVAVLNLLVTALLSLRRQRRELALTRAIGFAPQDVRRTVFWSDGLLGLVAALAGIPLGVALFLGVYRIVNGDTDRAALPPMWQMVLVPILCVAAVVTVVAIPAHQAARQSVSAGLRRE